MWTEQRPKLARLAALAGLLLLGGLVAWPLSRAAQGETPAAKEAGKDLAGQLQDLRAKVARLEAALKKAQPAAAPDRGGMPMGQGKMGMGGMEMGGMEMGGMGMGRMPGAAGAAGRGGMMDMDMMEMMGMMGMAPRGAGGMPGMKAMGKMQVQAALPGFPGASHIYHVGATDFFLDHPEHITLTVKQKGDLGRLKEKALLTKSTAQRKIDEAEQELWALTSADQPDAKQIEAKVREIEKLRGDQRLAFIRAVGEAARVLTDEQRQALLGTGAGKSDKPAPHAGHKP